MARLRTRRAGTGSSTGCAMTVPVRAAPDRLLGLRFDADTVRAFIDSIPGPKILVGHSYGGAVITQAASGDPQVKALVYVAAFAPTRGERLDQLLMRRVAHPIAPLPLVSIKVRQPNGTTRTDFDRSRRNSVRGLPLTCGRGSPLTWPRPSHPPAPRRSRPSSPSRRPGRRSPVGISWPSRTRRSRPTWSGSWPAASTRTPTRSTARTPSTSAIPRQSPASPSKPRKRPADPRKQSIKPERSLMDSARSVTGACASRETRCRRRRCRVTSKGGGSRLLPMGAAPPTSTSLVRRTGFADSGSSWRCCWRST